MGTWYSPREKGEDGKFGCCRYRRRPAATIPYQYSIGPRVGGFPEKPTIPANVLRLARRRLLAHWP
eukprot:289575-Heterocapsa_arctica.AAC.1